jgi:hypothetical protein
MMEALIALPIEQQRGDDEMTNEELDKAINTACRHGSQHYGHQEVGEVMLAHLKKLLAEQERRLTEKESK